MAIRRAKDPSAKPSRAQMDAIIRRYVKDGVTPDWRKDMPIAYNLFKRYPSLAFWTHHELPFGLNSMAWFLTEQGAAQLESDWVVFHYDIPKEPELPPIEILIKPPSPYHASPARPKTVAEFLRT
jgi:hypothetical protein